jgi:RimJ/RimL family protein N-acetyltransferase
MARIELLTPRLRLRPVQSEDLDVLERLGADERVMAPFGGAVSRAKTGEWLERLLLHWRAHGFGRYRVEHAGAFVGVVGLSRAEFDAGIVPGVEVAWRLAFDHWGRGFATEAARAAIDEGFERLGLDAVIAVTTPDNARSRRVMERLGMSFSASETFDHPLVPEGDPHRTHLVYRLARPSSPARA